MAKIPSADEINEKEWMTEAWDDVTALPLKAEMVKEARAVEMKYVKEMKVWERIERDEAKKRGIKVIKG